MRDYAVEYLSEVQKILTRVLETQTEAIHTAAEWIVDATLAGKKLWVVGCGHAGLLAQELFYRSGGLVVMNPLFAPGLQLDVSPVTLTSDIERIEGYGVKIIDRKEIGDGDLLIVMNLRADTAVKEISGEASAAGGADGSADNNLTLAAVLNTGEENITYDDGVLTLPGYSIAVFTMD